MKRFISLDILRGLSLVGVLFFHMLLVTFNIQGVIAQGLPWYYYSIVIPVVFFMQFNILFVVLSGLVNMV